MNFKSTLLLACLMYGGAIGAAQPRTMLPLSGEWKCSELRFDPLDYPLDKLPPGYEQSDFDDSKWALRRVPGNWREDSAEARSEKYMTGVYRRSILIPKPDAPGRVLLKFDGSAYDTTVWINGKPAGMHRGAFAAFDMDITGLVKFGENNQIAIRCDYTNDAGRRAVLLDHPFPGDRAGLWGKVWIEFVPEVYIRRALIDSDLQAESIRIRYQIRNTTGRTVPATIAARVSDADGKLNAAGEIGKFTLPPGDSTVEGNLKLDRPRRWSQQDPALYQLVSTLNENDVKSERFGFSKFEISGTKFRFNGGPVFLTARHLAGVDVPQTGVRRWGGFSMPEEEQKQLLKQNFLAQAADNVNMLRAHSGEPGPKFVYDAADEAGLLIYQEWSNYGVGKNLLPQYLGDFADEMIEWLYMVYNNPSVAMVSLANESPGFAEQTRCYDMVKPIFKERFPICSSSGFLPLISGKIEVFPKTDMIDIHTYEGMCFRSMSAGGKASWQAMCRNTQKMYDRCKASWKDGAKELALPFIAMEIPAGHWAAAQIGPAEDYLDEAGDLSPEAYIRAKELSEKQGPLSLGAWDMKNASLLDKFSGPEVNVEILNKINKRSIESIRRNPMISGVCVGSDRSICTVQPLVYQPLLICMEEQDFNWIAGAERKFTLTVINDSPNDYPASRLRLLLRRSDGKIVGFDGLKPDTPIMTRELTPATGTRNGTREQLAVSFHLPADLPSGDYRLDLELTCNGQTVSRNYYIIHAQNPTDWTPIDAGKKRIVLLFDPEAEAATDKVKKVLEKFGISCTPVPLTSPPEELKAALGKTDFAIVAPFELRKNGAIAAAGTLLRRWVESGGQLLSLETTGSGNLPWVPEWELGNEGATWFADIAPVAGHPIAKGLKQHHFDSWNGNDGHLADVMVLPFNVNMLAAAVCVMTDQLAAPAAEATVGKGRLLLSQFHALDRFWDDSIATTYLHNLLSYFLTQPVFGKVKPLTAGKKYSYDLDYSKCFYINLRPYVNRGFTDAVPGDHSGWTDQGENDLRHIPQGRMDEDKRVWDLAYNEELRDKQLFRGVPFDVIDQKTNHGKSCIVLKGELRRDFPAEVTGIRIGRKAARLYFLHTAVFGDSQRAADYVIRYADGTTETVPLRGQKEIADWWGPRHLENALLAWSAINPASKQNVGVYAFEYKNPHPEKEIASVDFKSAGTAVPILLAITGTIE